jgi:hypothetical protein
MQRRSLEWWGILVATAVMISACGASSTSSGTTGSTSPVKLTTQQAGSEYLSNVAPVESAEAAFAQEVLNWSYTSNVPFIQRSIVGAPTPTPERVVPPTELASAAQRLISVEEQFDSSLATIGWPASAQTDVTNLINENKAVVSDLQELPTLTTATQASWRSALRSDAATLAADSNLVRSDLGLPPAAQDQP